LFDFRIEVARSLIVDGGEDADVNDREEDNSKKAIVIGIIYLSPKNIS